LRVAAKQQIGFERRFDAFTKWIANGITEVVRYGYPEMQAGIAVDQFASVIGIPNEDAALVAELQAGSEQAFARLIDRYHQPLYSLIARSLQDPADASDITQEVFIKVFRSIGGFHGEASLRTWLYRIALREASNQRRWWSRHKRQEVAMDAPGCANFDADGEGESLPIGAALADGGCSPYDFAAQTEVRERVEAALREVPEAFRTVVVLREIEGFAYEEIAEILQVNLGTVKSRLTRGRAILRGLLAPASVARKPTLPVHSRRAAVVAGSLLGVSR
jgi:RNA polymerase sigma-70 factor (ECF subfamily)